jgi:hypothetical protein
MPTYVDFLMRSSAKVVDHCDTLLRSSKSPEERTRLVRRIEAEKNFVAGLLSDAGHRRAA